MLLPLLRLFALAECPINWGLPVAGKTLSVQNGDTLVFSWRSPRRAYSLVQFPGPGTCHQVRLLFQKAQDTGEADKSRLQEV